MGSGTPAAETRQPISDYPGATCRAGINTDRAFLALLVLYCVYAGLFIYRTSFVVGGERYFCLFDDAMISMRYARNLAHGHGLVWNPGGERVEGFTNPLWVLYMAPFHLLPIARAKLSLAIQISGAALLLACLLYVKRIAEVVSRRSGFVALGAVALTAFYLPLVNWSLQGMEVSLLAVLAAAAAWHLLRSWQRKAFSPLPYVLLGVATLVRMDAAVLLVAAFLFAGFADARHRKRHLAFGLCSLLGFISMQTVLRLVYYGDALPNTYYLKLTGYPSPLRMLRGLLVFVGFIRHLPFVLALVAFLPLLWRRDRQRLLLATMFGAQAGYSIYVGGDVWEWWGGSNRFMAVVMPLFFVVLALQIQELGLWAGSNIGKGRMSGAGWLRYGGAAAIALCVISTNAFRGRASLAEWLLVKPPLHAQDNELNVRAARIITDITTSDAKIALSWAGAIPYFCDREAIDLLGKCDRQVARNRARRIASWSTADGFVPGHWKWDYAHSIGGLQPDIVLRDISRSGPEKVDFARRYRLLELGEVQLYVRRGSPNIRWGQVEYLTQPNRETG